MTQRANPIINCPNCDAGLSAGTSICHECGSPLPEGITSSDKQGKSLDELIVKSNQILVDSGTRAAEIAFGVGCTLGLIINLVLMVIVFLTITKTWTVLAVILLIISLISILVSSLLSSRAKNATTRTTYERDIKPEFDFFLSENNLSIEVVTEKAGDLLLEDSPLLAYLSSKESH
jgi:ABC-type multidrug transport system fused ATPase/permease subunit